MDAATVDAALEARLHALKTRSVGATSARHARPPARKRRHAAKKSRIAALAMSLASTGGLTAAFATSSRDLVIPTAAPSSLVVNLPEVETPEVPAAASGTGDIAVTSPPTSGDVAATAPPTVVDSVPSAPVAEVPTVVDGEAFTNKWGTVQVQATFAPDGSLIDVVALRVPDGDRTSIRISDQAIPWLNEEALTAQSAHIDTLSGATYTSNDYRQSLQSAIDAARAEEITQIS